jgi:hypothetical protein
MPPVMRPQVRSSGDWIGKQGEAVLTWPTSTTVTIVEFVIIVWCGLTAEWLTCGTFRFAWYWSNDA